jgi:molybdenum cofactor guanylyltransferase
VPFLPTAILQSWAAAMTTPDETVRVAMFTVEGRPQPTVCLLHKQIAPSIAAAVALGEFKLLSVLEASAEVLGLQNNQPLDQLLSIRPIDSDSYRLPGISPAQQAIQHLWFANLNTPEDFAAAEEAAEKVEFGGDGAEPGARAR